MRIIRFSIRDIILLTVIIAIALGWLVDHKIQRIQQQWLTRELAGTIVVVHEIEDEEATAGIRNAIYKAREQSKASRKSAIDKAATMGHKLNLPREEDSALYTPEALSIAPIKPAPTSQTPGK